MLRGKVTMGSTPSIVLWACSGIWWMCMVWAGAHSSVHPPAPFILVADVTQSIDLPAAGNKSLCDLLESGTRLSDIDKENTVNVMQDQYRKAVRNSTIRNGNIFNRKIRSSSIHAVPYDCVTKNLVNFHTFHDKIRHFLKFTRSYGGRHGLKEREMFFVSQEKKLDNISSLEQASAMDIGNAQQPVAMRSKYSNGSATSSTNSTSETSFTNNSVEFLNFCDRHTPSPKRMNHNITAEKTAVFRCKEFPPKKLNQMCIYDVDGSNCLVNTSKIHVYTHSHVHNSFPSPNCCVYVSRCDPNVSYTVNESENVKIESKSDKARDNEKKRLNLTFNVVSEQIISDFMKRHLHYTDHLGSKLEQIETDKYSHDKPLETLKNEVKTWRNEVHHDHVGNHETSSLNQHGDDGSGDDEDSYSRYKTLGRIYNFKKTNRTGDLQHEGQVTVRGLRGLNSPTVTSSWNVKENIIESAPDLMSNKNNIKLIDRYWQPMWYNVR